jgi:hypothetical protein
MTHAVIPAAAPDLPLMISTVKYGLLRQFCSTQVHAFSGVLSLSKAMSACKN